MKEQIKISIITIILIFGGLIMWGIIGSVLSAGMKIAETGYNHIQNKKAYDLSKESMAFQKNQFEWAKQQANITRQREDTAIQRRSADLKAAGFNPYLSENTGAGATTVSASGGSGASYSGGYNSQMNLASDVINIMQMNEALKSQKLQNKLQQYEVDELVNKKYEDQLRREFMRLQNETEKKKKEEIEENIKRIKTQWKTDLHNLNVSKRWNLRTSDSVDSRAATIWAGLNEGKATIEGNQGYNGRQSNEVQNEYKAKKVSGKKLGNGYIVDGKWFKDIDEVLYYKQRNNWSIEWEK